MGCSLVHHPMRILHIITRLIQGGAQQNTVLSCEAQVRAGHEVHLAYGPIYGPEGSLLDEAKASGAVLHEIGTMVRPVHPWKDYRCYKSLLQLMHRDIGPEVVHTHSSKAGIVGRAAGWKYASDIRHLLYEFSDDTPSPVVVHTVHGLPFHGQQGRFTNRLYVASERWAAKRCHHLIAITPAMVEAFEQKRIAGPDRFTVIPSGIDLSRFQPRPEERDAVRGELGIPAGAKVVGLVARLDPLKGHADLMDVLPKLRTDGRDVWLLFVGDGFGRAQVESHPGCQSGRVIFSGFQPFDRIPGLLSAMDVMVLPSYQEGQSRTLAEALLCGVPIVAYEVGGIGSICIDGETGRLVPVGDTAALADAIVGQLDDPQAARGMAERGRAHVRDKFDAKTMTRQIEQLYQEVLNRKP